MSVCLYFFFVSASLCLCLSLSLSLPSLSPFFSFPLLLIGIFPPSWYSNVRDIAAKSPLLICAGAEGYLEKELELSHPLRKRDISLSELQEARLALLDTIGHSPELDKLVNRLTFVQCMFLQSIYRVEAVR